MRFVFESVRLMIGNGRFGHKDQWVCFKDVSFCDSVPNELTWVDQFIIVVVELCDWFVTVSIVKIF